MPQLNPASKGTWGERNYNAYSSAGTRNALRKELQTGKTFSEKYKVPVFCGEWGSYKKFADPASRCRYTATIKDLLNELHIAYAYWEWDQGFSFFDGEPAMQNIPECMRTVWGF